MSQTRWIAGVALIVALAADAQTMPGGAATHCASAEYRQFDFWIGEWDVTQNSKPAGSNSIRSILGGCAISEEWAGTGGFKGVSVNFYNAETRRWHQTWIDSQGQALALEGSFESGSMVLQNSVSEKSGTTPRHRIAWTPMPDKTVRQLWQVQEAPGADWKTLFDGRYSLRSQPK